MNKIIIAVSILIISCDLADTSLTSDDTRIIPDIQLTAARNARDNSIHYLTKVYIRNEAGDELKIADGGVWINDVKMVPPSTTIFPIEDYHSYYKSTVRLNPDSLYTIRILNSDSTENFAWILTPDIDLTVLNIPERYPRKTTLTLSWQNTDFRYPQQIHIDLYDADAGKYKNDATLLIEYPYTGSYTINRKYIKHTNVSDEVSAEMKIILIAETLGALDNTLPVESKIKAQFTIYKTLEIY
ncbi:MAG: hypothetical protein GXO90_01330 [FCB group bacterium]|nr:hypothetical protein [FCB group bacterium]